uniref:Peptidase S8/S53 domain-containing protein n=1 Tax=Panagrolaimus sp. PS1159 TaxID=55785 RepID=A0AC35G9E3_9BILA
MNVDIINFSVGGFPRDEFELMKKMVEKHGIIILNAAGNDGPITFSHDELNEYQNCVLNIGSCLSSETKHILYNINYDKAYVPPIVSPFSSQGPMHQSGGCGVTLVAPGHGVAEMPRHYSYKTQLYAATSYCCPNAVGAILCLISGLKAKSIPITFLKIKLAIINTAFLPKNGCKLSFGNGIIQIKSAFKFYVKNLNNFPIQITNITASLIEKNMLWKKLWDNSDCKSGITLKVTDKNKKIYNYVVKINVNSNFSNENLIKIKWILKLSKNAETFIKGLSTVNDNDEFSFNIDITELKGNSINYAEIIGFDSSNLFWGPLLYFSITIIIPKNFYETEKIDEIIELNSIFLYRLFIPPFSSEICRFFVQLKCLEEEEVEVQVKFS